MATALLWMMPVSAEETAEDVVSMMSWWEDYGRYWDELGSESTVVEEEMAFAALNGALVELPVPTERGLP